MVSIIVRYTTLEIRAAFYAGFLKLKKMKTLLLVLVASICLIGCDKISNEPKTTYTGTLYKDCNRTPFANTRIAYTTVRNQSLGGYATQSFETQTDANGRFSITEASGLRTITIELAMPPKYENGPLIVQFDYPYAGSSRSTDTTYNLGELFYVKLGVEVGGAIEFYSNLNLKISSYYQQKDSLIIGFFLKQPLIISPVPATYKGIIAGSGKSDFFVSTSAINSGRLLWATSLEDYNKAFTTSTLPPKVYKGEAKFFICGNGSATDFVVDTFSHN